MKFSLIICTYMRPKPLFNLLESVHLQALYPDEILIIDGSKNEETQELLQQHRYKSLQYFKVNDADRGLTRQRNYGIQRVAKNIEVVCFLDDDTILDPHYFENIIKTYDLYPDALGVGGSISNEDAWVFVGENYKPTINDYLYDGWKKKDGSRFVLRKKLGLDSDASRLSSGVASTTTTCVGG